MWRIAARRLLGGLFVLWAVHLATFSTLRLLPGDPWDALAGDRDLPPAAVAALRAKYGADRSFVAQYLTDVGGILRLDFGVSLSLARGQPVLDLLAHAAPTSIAIGCGALLVGSSSGIALGVMAARRAGRWPDRVVRMVASAGVGVPDFVIGTAVLLVFALALGWFPAGGLASPLGLVLPVLTLAIPLAAATARLTRTSLLDELSAPYARTARAKGADEQRIAVGHCLRPALGPVFAWLAQAAANLLTGSMVVEALFALPGLGYYFVAGAMQRDWTVVAGAAVAYALLLVLCNLVADLVLVAMDPRTR